jgi:hypothetical protein
MEEIDVFLTIMAMVVLIVTILPALFRRLEGIEKKKREQMKEHRPTPAPDRHINLLLEYFERREKEKREQMKEYRLTPAAQHRPAPDRHTERVPFKSDVFISYAREDRGRIEVLARALAEARGWSAWWDRDIPFGKAFDQIVWEAINNTRCVVVAWSSQSIKSNWVIEEALYGREHGILVPVLLDDVQPPFGFHRIQAADLQDWDGTAENAVFQKLVADIANVIGQ